MIMLNAELYNDYFIRLLERVAPVVTEANYRAYNAPGEREVLYDSAEIAKASNQIVKAILKEVYG